MCANSTSHPLLDRPTLEHGLPRFADIDDGVVREAFPEALRRHREQIRAIADNPAEPTWENTVEALEASGRELGRCTAWLFNMLGTDSTDARQGIAEEIIPELSAHSDALYTDAALHARIKAVTAPEGDGEGARLHAHLLRRFTRRGADLPPDAQRELAEINRRLSVLSDAFGNNLLADTRTHALHVTDVNELDGLSPARISAARSAAEAEGRDGYLIPLELPTVQSALTDLTDPGTRAALHAASQRRGAEKNPAVLVEMVKLRARRAALLGYDTHADYVIEEETARTADAARRMLTDLAPAAAANAAAEHKLLVELADTEVTGADWPYWEAKLKARDYDLDEDELRRHFPLGRVLRDGVFFAANRLYGITVTERPDLEAYHPDADVWEVRDTDGTALGLLITDYFARPGKRGGAWMTSFTEQSRLLGTTPVVANVMSIVRPTDGSEPLLTLDEVTTVFHEFGHGLHGLLSDVRYPTFSGTNVPRDWVEFPSQINENWAFDPEVIRNYARHVDTGEVIPDHLLTAVADARQFGQGFAAGEYLGAAVIDLAWHSLTPEQADQLGDGAEDIEAFENRALEDAGLTVEHLRPRYRSTYFNHVFAGGYSAGYYSYLWAEVLDADGFDGFAEQGAAGEAASPEAVRAAGQRFRDLILSRGGADDFGTAFAAFRGRGKDVAPLLSRRGLAGAV
ncbi:M3 family metallopeptidase [Corynebacterium pygosceleis]|uniref:M3 family metallopeptidase n=1 Tax=Corynebacterium pygosceleis TaxID=2800406 RepID=A0A9Q4C6B8_9CORY|nr:M3 family metallopeptidase [Corynebacterium pygosceleis]MCK7636524.1 M3 family metallopeptidase [Corynebacterium pygosceleis]MCK7675098.1 M3 family metallopeptidase [Corynebacterium pygosceleis]MCL0120700.1 M3 family metallopeptidase [Corynebacterium pygosceleis]MCX7444240.1 M3 family metallopeptidase [Corynebacterium pygosceleis]MCX7467277.1 M3 family metallopeptidase [Corynebacterium pygosceleis]